MKVQHVKFQRDSFSDEEHGIAFLNNDFENSSVKFIVTLKGERLPTVWDYSLQTHPLAHIDTEYAG